MRSRNELLLLLLMALPVGLALWRPWSAHEHPMREVTADPPPASAELERAVDRPEQVGDAREEAGREPANEPPGEEPAQDEAEEPWPRSLIRGRVVSGGVGLSGARAVFYTVGESWIDDPSFEGEVGSTEATTDEEGRFEFDLALPTSSWISLSVSCPPFHTRTSREFGFAGGRKEPPLVPGDNDLGDLILQPAGTVRGQVRNGGAELPTGTRISISLSASASTISCGLDEEGHYELSGVPPGRHSVRARSEGFLSVTRDSIEVVAGEVTEGVDFSLEPAETISGRVVDEDSRPVMGAKITGRSVTPGSSRTCSTRSAEDGTFELFLHGKGEYMVSASREGYQPFDGSSGPYHESGATGVMLLLPRMTTARFRVLDAQRDEPIERFGLKLLRARSPGKTHYSTSGDDQPAAVERHPGGEVLLSADPRWHDVTLVAPGRADLRARVAWDREGEQVMTLRMEPEGVLRGRVVSGGVPVPRVGIELEGDHVALVPGASPDDDMAVLLGHWGRDLDEFAARERLRGGDDDGSFEVVGLAEGTYELTLSAPGSSPRLIEGLAITAGEVLDLGDIELARPAELSGRVLLGGAPTEGLQLYLSEEARTWPTNGILQVLDAEGRFRFVDLAERDYFLRLRESDGRVIQGPAVPVSLVAGEERELTVDLGDRVCCRIEARVLINGAPAEDIRLRFVLEGDGPEGLVWKEQTTGGDGVAWMDVPGSGRGRLEALGGGKFVLGASAGELQLAPGQVREVELDLQLGRLEVTLDSAALEKSARLRVKPLDAGDEKVFYTDFDEPVPGPAPGLLTCDLGWFRPGPYRVALVQAGKIPPQELLEGEATVGALTRTSLLLEP